MSGRLSKRKLFINLEGVVRRRWGGNEKEWIILTELRPGVWYGGGLESDGVAGRSVG